jgi:hypothetical protein
MGMSNAERQRNYVARLKARAVSNGQVEALQAKCAKLAKDLAAARARIRELTGGKKARRTA